MIIIASAEFVPGDLRSEFGRIPPSFLPIGNKPLLFWQANLLAKSFPDERIVVSVPEGFALTGAHNSVVEKFALEVVRVPRGLTLSASILFVLNVALLRDTQVRILHGDTLIGTAPLDLDIIGVAPSQDTYAWDASEESQDGNAVWCGFFSFSRPTELIRALAMHPKEFATAVRQYRDEVVLNDQPIQDWLDGGHLNTYFGMREAFTTQRSFNDLRIENGLVTKRGNPPQKIVNEANWYASLPPMTKRFAPAFYELNQAVPSYTIEYLPMVPLNEIFVHGRQPLAFWEKVLSFVENWFDEAQSFSKSYGAGDASARTELIEGKTVRRLEEFGSDSRFNTNEPLKLNGFELPAPTQIANECIKHCLNLEPIWGLVHGDLCFSNCLIDSRNERLRVLDPRGIDEPESAALVGDLAYDAAKFLHSAVGMYDVILAGESIFTSKTTSVNLQIHTTREQDELARLVLENGFAGFPAEQVREFLPLVVLLFLSMAPLHSDDPLRQHALFSNGLLLYQKYVKEV